MRGSERDVVLDRDDLVDLLMAVCDDPVEVGRVVNYVETAFELQTDLARPAYIFEASPDITPNDVEWLREAAQRMRVQILLLPAGAVDYVGKVTPKSMGVENVRIRSYGLEPMADRGVD